MTLDLNLDEMIIEVVGIDPGETTGWAVLGCQASALLGAKSIGDSLHKHVRVQTGQISCKIGLSENDGVDFLRDLTWDHYEAPIAMEDFIVDFTKMDKNKSTLSALRVAMKLEYALWSRSEPDINRITYQLASLAKTTCTDERLKEWNLYDRASGVHARDASRHAYYFLRGCRGNTVDAAEKRWKAWPDYFPDPLAHGIRKVPNGGRPLGERVLGLG